MQRAPNAPLIVASNRGPVGHRRRKDGTLEPRRGSGGLVTALLGAVQSTGGLWVAAAMSEGDREIVRRTGDGRVEARVEGSEYRLRYIAVPSRTYDRYYNVVSNRILWFLHHYLWDTVRSPVFDGGTDAAWNDYAAVNRMFAEALAEESAERPFLVQDYHLALVPRMLRELLPSASIAHFSHTPFAGTTYLRILPAAMRDALLRGMLGADVLGFQTRAWAENFLLSARSVSGARVDVASARVMLDGHETLVRVYPISVEAEPLREAAAAPRARARASELASWLGDRRLILRVDRLELTKNIVRGFRAYETFLRRNPRWRGRVVFLALLSPSREDLREYRTYAEECEAEAKRVNAELGEPGWTPIELRIRDDHVGTVAAYGLYDVLFVNPVYDGMNLVAMEGPLINGRNGVLVLSRNAGAYSRLGRYAIGVNPFDIGEMADALAGALEMPMDERARRARGLARLVLANPTSRWVGSQLEDLRKARERRDRARRGRR